MIIHANLEMRGISAQFVKSPFFYMDFYAFNKAKGMDFIMNFNKEQLTAINGLHLSGIINDMEDSQFSEYTEALFAFTESFPAHEAGLKNSIAAKDYDTFYKLLSDFRDVLEKIQATGLAQSCRKLMEELTAKKHEIVEAHLTYLLAEIAALSIDIQMAQHLPETLSKAETKAATDIPGNERGEDGQKSILAVDDVSFLLVTLKSILQNAGYRFAGVTSGEAALRYVEKHKPDLFILDIEMPEMNGYELAEKLKSLGLTAPVIFLTGNATRQYVQKAIEVGAADFIVKPVNKEQVLEKIKIHIG